MNCIFCKIIKGESPSYTVFDNNDFIAILDLYPRSRGHTLVIPKKHYQWVYDVPNFGAYWETALHVTRAIQKALTPEFITYVTHGLEIPHAHIHIVPRQKGEHVFVPDIKKFAREEMEEIAEKIRREIKNG